MKTAFIETSAINWLYKSQFDAVQTNELLASIDFTPIVGMDTIYELARCFITKPDVGVKLFSFLEQLKPIYSCQRKALYDQEIRNLLEGAVVDTLLGYYSKEILTERIKQYSTGVFASAHEEFIAGRQFFWDDCREKLWRPENIKKNRGLIFQDYLSHCLRQIESPPLILQKWVQELTGKILSKKNTISLIKKLNTFPALRTALYSQFYLNFLIIKNQATPSEDKFTDSLQIIAGSYSSVIISHDKYLINTLVSAINPIQSVLDISSAIESAHT